MRLGLILDCLHLWLLEYIFGLGFFNAQEMLALRQFTHGKISPSIYTGDHLK